jgi:hypothetical protein
MTASLMQALLEELEVDLDQTKERQASIERFRWKAQEESKSWSVSS